MKRKNKIELLPAFRWTCDHCGIENFGAAYEDTESYLESALQDWREEENDHNELPSDFSDDEIRDVLREEMHDENITLFFKFPEEVTCLHCQETFETDIDDEEEEEEEDATDV